jgi:hypothetical protein
VTIGWVAKAIPPVEVLLGWVVMTNWVAVPAVMATDVVPQDWEVAVFVAVMVCVSAFSSP